MKIDKNIKIQTEERVVIDKQYPVPEACRRTGKKGRPNIYPFHDMEIGDSIFLEGQGHNSGARGSVKSFSARYGKKFSSRIVDGGIRIWRIA